MKKILLAVTVLCLAEGFDATSGNSVTPEDTRGYFNVARAANTDITTDGVKMYLSFKIIN